MAKMDDKTEIQKKNWNIRMKNHARYKTQIIQNSFDQLNCELLAYVKQQTVNYPYVIWMMRIS